MAYIFFSYSATVLDIKVAANTGLDAKKIPIYQENWKNKKIALVNITETTLYFKHTY